MSHKSRDPKIARTGAVIMVVLGGIWLFGAVVMSFAVSGFLPIGLMWYAVAIGFILTGIHHYRHADDAPRKPLRSLEPQPPRHTATTTPGNADLMRLYQQDLSHYHLPQFTLDNLAVSLTLDCPMLLVTMACFAENRAGGGLNYRTSSTPIPQELLGDLTPASLCTWIRQTLPDDTAETLPWSSIEGTPGLALWCHRVSVMAGLQIPAPLYQCANPFDDALRDVGPDGLHDESGVGCWLALRDGADIHQAIRTAAEWMDSINSNSIQLDRFIYQQLAGLRKVIVTADQHLLDQVTDEEKQQCRQRGITFALAFPEGLYDLLEEKDIPLTWQEWPGAADDAATYGEWQLTWS